MERISDTNESRRQNISVVSSCTLDRLQHLKIRAATAAITWRQLTAGTGRAGSAAVSCQLFSCRGLGGAKQRRGHARLLSGRRRGPTTLSGEKLNWTQRGEAGGGP